MARRRYFTPLPAPQQPAEEVTTTRIVGMAATVVALFGILAARLWLLQIVRGEEHREKALLNRNRTVRTTAPRGVIVDSQGRVLVANTSKRVILLRPEESVGFTALLRIVDPDRLKPKKPVDPKKPQKPVVLSEKKKAQLKELDEKTQLYLNRLAQLINVPRTELDATLKSKLAGKNDPVPILEGIDSYLMARIYERKDDLPGISVEVLPMRSYTFPNRATHILGYAGTVNEKELASEELASYPPEKRYRPGDMVGKVGLEKYYDSYLRGTLGEESFEVDGRGRRRKEVGSKPAKSGATLVLALDEQVQAAAEKALGGAHGAIVAIDPRNGHVLAMASGPTYDLTTWLTKRTPEYVQKVREGKAEINRSISRFPPGSTFKIVTMAAGLATGKLPSGAYCTGAISMGGGRPKKCHGTHGSVSPLSAFAQSCDVFYYRAGERIGDESLAEWARNFGLGSKTGLDLPFEAKGTIPTEKWAKEVRKEGWWRGNLYDMAIGQGYDEATPLQIALVASAIANGGTVWRPQLVAKVVDSDDPKNILLENKPEALHKLALTSAQISQIQRAMRAVVDSGTGKRADVGGVQVYGKTGTAEAGATAKAHGWFTGYAARRGEAPSIAICVFREALRPGHNYHGGDVCAPLASYVIDAYFNRQAELRGASSKQPEEKPEEKPEPRRRRQRR